MKRAFLSLGGNMGDTAALLREAARKLDGRSDITVIAKSSLYRSEPWGHTDQPDFINGALALLTELEPLALLDICQELEAQAGRERPLHWGPRSLDIDIISMDGVVLDDTRLILPHPLYQERRFVLQPLMDILGDETAPPLAPLRPLLAACAQRPAIYRLPDLTW